MFKTLIKLAVVLAIGLLTYNFFLGSPEEKEASQKVVGQVRDLGASVFDLLKSEQEKLSAGKYDEALANLKQVIGIEREQSAALGHEGQACLDECDHLDHRQVDLEQELASVRSDTSLSESAQDAALQTIYEKIRSLAHDAESLANELHQ